MVKIINHPLIKIYLTKIRNKNSSHLVFSNNLNKICKLMAFEILKNLKIKEIPIETPLETTIGYEFDTEIVIIGILRAGLGLMNSMKEIIPEAKMGHIGLYRDEKTYKIHKYFFKIPKVSKKTQIILVDPMLATGASALEAINLLKKEGYNNISLVNIVGVDEGIDLIKKHHPDIKIFLAAKDRKLNDDKYIVPGLGDAGDRIFGTK